MCIRDSIITDEGVKAAVKLSARYINDDPTAIVSNLKNIGYTTVAMHPYLSLIHI